MPIKLRFMIMLFTIVTKFCQHQSHSADMVVKLHQHWSFIDNKVLSTSKSSTSLSYIAEISQNSCLYRIPPMHRPQYCIVSFQSVAGFQHSTAQHKVAPLWAQRPLGVSVWVTVRDSVVVELLLGQKQQKHAKLSRNQWLLQVRQGLSSSQFLALVLRPLLLFHQPLS